MIRIEDFLFTENVETSLSQTLITRFPNLSFNRIDDFYKFFESKNIRLVKNASSMGEEQSLLQRFKDFKTSTDYGSMKRYIKLQRQIKSLTTLGKYDEASVIMQSINDMRVDNFFDFVVRKILTGNVAGKLPSEELQVKLDEINSRVDDIDKQVDVTRDSDGTIQSFKNYLKNKGTLKVNLMDTRYFIDSFNYTVNTAFSSLEEAVNAETNILKNTRNLPTGEITGSFQNELKKLISLDSNSIPSLQSKIDQMTDTIFALQETMANQEESMDEYSTIIQELSRQRNLLLQEIESKDETIVELNNTISDTLDTLQETVMSKIQGSEDLLSDLTKKLEEQAKQAQQNSEKQLKAFESAISNIANTLKPKEDTSTSDSSKEDSPEEKRRKEKIKTILTEWDDIVYINSSNDDDLISLMKLFGVNVGSERYKFVDIQSGKLKDRLKAISTWNTMYKSQYRQYINDFSIKTEADADAALAYIRRLKTNTSGESSIRRMIYSDPYAGGNGDCGGDVFDRWRNDCNRSRGVNEQKVREIYDFIGESWENGGTSRLEAKMSTMTIQDIIQVINIINEFPGDFN